MWITIFPLCLLVFSLSVFFDLEKSMSSLKTISSFSKRPHFIISPSSRVTQKKLWPPWSNNYPYKSISRFKCQRVTSKLTFAFIIFLRLLYPICNCLYIFEIFFENLCRFYMLPNLPRYHISHNSAKAIMLVFRRHCSVTSPHLINLLIHLTNC